jgi:uncharacterized protein YndB with AHSA1/START domain
METASKTKVTIATSVNAPVHKVWEFWSKPEHITKWGFASPDWHTPRAENDLRDGGKFNSRMEAKDGSMGFDFWGTYDEVKPNKTINYTMGDGRKVWTNFEAKDNRTDITQIFEAETENPVEMQKGGWQAILDNFKKYAESN